MANTKDEIIAAIVLKPGWREINQLGQDQRVLKLSDDDTHRLQSHGCSNEDIEAFLSRMGVTAPEVGNLSNRAKQVVVAPSDYNRVVRPAIPDIDHFEPVPLPTCYEDVTRSQIEAAKKGLFQNGWKDSHYGESERTSIDGRIPVKVKSFPRNELLGDGVNTVVFDYVLRKQLGVNPDLLGVSSLGGVLKVVVGVDDYNKHIAPQIRTAAVE